MRLPLLILLALWAATVYGPALAAPATALAPAAPAATKPHAAIIPGSPLAALTGAPPEDTDASTPPPFGTNGIGLSLAGTLGTDATRTFEDFSAAFQRSTQLGPVLVWLRGFGAIPARRADALHILLGLLITLIPGLAVESAIRLGLRRPRAYLLGRAAPPPADMAEPEEEPAPADGAEEEQGLADAEAGETEHRPRRRDNLLAWGRRLFFGLGHLFLSLLPLLGFTLAVTMLIGSGALATRPAELAVTGIANFYIACRLVMEVLRFLAAPGAVQPVRLLAMPDSRARAIIRQMRIILGSALLAYALISTAEILGLGREGARVLIRLAALILHIEVAVLVWKSRHVVGRWIAGRRDAAGALAGFRRRLGQVWHYLALFYVLALWIALAGGVHHAFAILLRVVLVCIAAAFMGRLAWSGSSALLARAFPDATAATARHPELYARARAYNPLVRGLIRGIIGFLVIILVLQGWGLNAVGWLATDPVSRALIAAFIAILITIAVALIVWEAANAFLNGRIERLTTTGRTRQASRLRTLLPMLRATIGAVIFLVAGLICLSKIGVNAAPLLAGAGVVGIAVGFGSQKLVQDIITGLFLLLEDAMQVGDVVTLAGMSGTVERLSIRTIRLRGGDGSINIIPFSSVTTVTNQTRDFGYAQISVQVGYEEDLQRVYDVLREISKEMRAEPRWGAMMRDDLQIFGLDQFGASALVITGQIRTGPGQHWAVRREFYARVKTRFAAEHIDMPYTYLPPAPPRPAGQAQEEGR